MPVEIPLSSLLPQRCGCERQRLSQEASGWIEGGQGPPSLAFPSLCLFVLCRLLLLLQHRLEYVGRQGSGYEWNWS